MMEQVNHKGQSLTEYALVIAVAIISLVVINKALIGLVGRVLLRVVETVSLPFP